jgi:hypothetical protein
MRISRRVGCSTLIAPLLVVAGMGCAAGDSAAYIRTHYTKQELRVPMRDGIRLATSVYSPKDTSKAYPILLFRTPYSIRPYGEGEYPEKLGPNMDFVREGYIFVNQDVRGCYMSEGHFTNMTPHIDKKQSPTDVDESSDTYDTISWLLDHVPNHNGRVGQWGISYPGFYASAGMIDAHPALEAVSPQAPIADWGFDDFRHHGAFFLPHAFNFFASFGKPRPAPTTERHERFDHQTPDGYQFFMNLGPLKNANERYFHGEIDFWNKIVEHPNYDGFWQSRNLLPHLKNVAPAVMTVGGWFDAEDLYGALNTYQAIERQNPGIFNVLVMGPWQHGGWSRTDGTRLGNIHFGAKTSEFYQRAMELPFFNHFLKDKGPADLPEAYMFETGANRWRLFDHWPPRDLQAKSLYFHADGVLAFEDLPDDGEAYDQFVSDPARPVPFTEAITTGMTREYMTDDQRFASRRPDVLVYQTDVLKEDTTLAGPITAELWVSTSQSAADWVVKVIDVFPDDAENFDEATQTRPIGGYQMMVRSEVIRGRYRDSYEHPQPFIPNQPTRVVLGLQDVLHTFQQGHRIMVQVQSTWFPLVDRNPQKYVDNVFLADDEDFVVAEHRVYRSRQCPTRLRVGILGNGSQAMKDGLAGSRAAREADLSKAPFGR